MVVDGCWVPLAGEDDIYLHFFIYITEYAAEHMFSGKGCAASSDCSSCSGA
jgi:hypothetical protein